MSTDAVLNRVRPTAVPSGAMSRRRLFGAYLAEARSECLRYLRAPAFILPMTLFSTVFYLMFGVLINHGNADAARYLLAHVVLSWSQIAAMLAVGSLGVLPFCALGMFVGTLIKGQGAPGLLNLVYLPMAFLSGLWLPLPMLPQVVRKFAPIWPSYHLNQLTLAAVGMNNRAEPWPHALVLAGFALAFLLLAARRLRRYG
ncbi:MAG: ABC transporter permease [Rhodanobacter sp.]|nr:MAG: ABC transporter permease [Rhodanobacter sp.]